MGSDRQHEPFRSIYGDYLGTIDVLGKVLGSYLKDKSCEKCICLFSVKYHFLTYLHPQEVFSCVFFLL